MKTKYWLSCWQLRFVGFFLTTIWLSSFTDKALPQSTPSNIQADETLGTESSQIIQNFQGQPLELITGGATRGINLFHSFREFNVSEGREAYFFNPSAGIQNILARVTGRNRSEILGTLGTSGNSQPNLFLINPYGIIFGENASLDVQGSFVGTTANEIQFGFQGLFSATNPQAPALLTINPSAILFNQINRNAAIQNNASTTGLNVAEGRSLLLVGGSVSMNGGTLFAPGGRVELGGLAEPGRVELDVNGNNLSLKFPDNVMRGDISLTHQATVFVLGAGGGDIAFNARNIDILGSSSIFSGLLSGLGTPDTVAGDITLHATEQVKVGQGSQIRNAVLANAIGKGGDLTIRTKDLLVQDGAQLSVRTSSAGKGGNLNVNAFNKVELIGRSVDGRASSGLFVSTDSPKIGDAGDLRITTKDLLVYNGAQINATTFGAGKGGNLTVNAANSIQLISNSADGSFISALSASAERSSTGNGGDLTITTKNLLVRDGAQIGAGTFGAGKGGDLTVDASNQVEVIGKSLNGRATSSLSAQANSGSTGDAGNLTITTQDLVLRDGAQVGAGTFGTGKGGNLTVNASNKLELIGISVDGRVGSGLFTRANGRLTGDAGDLIINAHNVLVRDGAQVSTDTLGATKGGDLTINTQNLLIQGGAQVGAGTFGAGKGGNLTVNASNKVEVIGSSSNGRVASGIYVQANSVSTGDAGDLKINTQSLTVRDGAQVSTATLGRGKGGNLSVNASNKVEVIGRSTDGRATSGLFTSTDIRSTKNGGDLTIKTQDLVVRDGAQVSTATFGTGKGGNLSVNASNKVEVIGRSVDGLVGTALGSSTEDSTGNAGDLTVNTKDFFVRDGAFITAGTSGAGKGGNLTINASGKLEMSGTSVDGRFSSTLFASAKRSSTGNAGDLTINTNQLLLIEGAEVSVESLGMGNAGIMTINADTIRLDNQASLNANTRSPNKDPNREQATINLNTQNLTLRRNSSITTNASGENVIGGNINIKTKFLIAPENSRISANSDNSRGGRVRINARGVFVGTKLSDVSNYITATSGVGLSGSVDVNSPDNSSLQNSLTELSQNLIDTNALLANSCIVRSQEKQQSSFTITGTGGLPNRPGDASMSNYSTGDVRNITNENTSLHWKKGDPIIEPQGVYRLSDGKLVMSRECQ
ncbi:filamentous hemagglutinin N-terminal domain-containing protein [Scytonema sp. NUACC26]|uniref:two-partner secretion domain-containing protein n=1 Tax=Scytonema sp. NUACC26 TaxID=3140176 RepID=UPI0034DC4728